MLFNQRYWGQFARKQWLINGDRNSKFFHQIGSVRKRRCNIVRIKDEAGVWLDEIASIKDKFILEFSCRFKSSRSPFWSPPDLSISPLVTTEDNLELIRPVSDEEIHAATTRLQDQMGSGLLSINNIGLLSRNNYVLPSKTFSVQGNY